VTQSDVSGSAVADGVWSEVEKFCLLGRMRQTCYDDAMKAFVGEVDHSGLRRFVPEDAIPRDELGRLARGPMSRPTTVVWALLDDQDAAAVRTEVTAGRHHRACGLLLNAAVELLPITAAIPGTAPMA
jgi:hypothetical protein